MQKAGPFRMKAASCASQALWAGGVEVWPSPASAKSLLKCHLGTAACSFAVATAPSQAPLPAPFTQPPPDTAASSHHSSDLEFRFLKCALFPPSPDRRVNSRRAGVSGLSIGAP